MKVTNIKCPRCKKPVYGIRTRVITEKGDKGPWTKPYCPSCAYVEGDKID